MSRLFAISDLHLPGGTGKTMDQFGPEWIDHAAKIEAHWLRMVAPEDLVLIPGDISWAMKLEEARADLERIGSWPGTKILVRGNHDYWWQGIGKVRRQLPPGMYALQNDAVCFQGWHFCGTRGWPGPGGDGFTAEDEKIYRRELERFQLSLSAGRGADVLVALLHYPPFDERYYPTEFVALMKEYGVKICCYGHLHGPKGNYVPQGEIDGIRYHLVACDQLDFKPLLLGKIK